MPTTKTLSATIILDSELRFTEGQRSTLAAKLSQAGADCQLRWINLPPNAILSGAHESDVTNADLIIFCGLASNWLKFQALFPSALVFAVAGIVKPGRAILVRPTGVPPPEVPAPSLAFSGAINTPMAQVSRSYLQTRLLNLLLDIANVPRPMYLHLAAQHSTAGDGASRDKPKLENRANCYDVWFATNRLPKNPRNPGLGFRGRRDDHLHFGIARVSIPKAHRIGETGTTWWRKVLRLQFEDDQLRIRECRVMAEAPFWMSIREQLAARPPNERMALAFIHGFNVSFHESVVRAAQIGFDLKIPLTALFSWPAVGLITPTAYKADEASIEASEQFIEHFLAKLAITQHLEAVHVIAHSMGNRGTLRALERIAANVQAQSKVRFGQIILAAPDVDREVFIHLAAAHRALSARTTLYACSRDKALWLSKTISRGYPRAGYPPPITLVSGVDTIDATSVDLEPLGHGYVAQAEPVLRDMHAMIKYNKAPAERFGLVKRTHEALPYWEIQRAHRRLINP
jgi:esterase/lipase superfamily enzyme